MAWERERAEVFQAGEVDGIPIADPRPSGPTLHRSGPGHIRELFSLIDDDEDDRLGAAQWPEPFRAHDIDRWERSTT